MGRQYDHIPAAAGLLFAGIFGTLHHVAWLPLGLALGASLLWVDTVIAVDSERIRICSKLVGLTVRCRQWPLASMEAAVLVEHRDATTYTSHSIRNTVRAHSFLLTARMPEGDVELYEFTTRQEGMKVLVALSEHNVKTR